MFVCLHARQCHAVSCDATQCDVMWCYVWLCFVNFKLSFLLCSLTCFLLNAGHCKLLLLLLAWNKPSIIPCKFILCTYIYIRIHLHVYTRRRKCKCVTDEIIAHVEPLFIFLRSPELNTLRLGSRCGRWDIGRCGAALWYRWTGPWCCARDTRIVSCHVWLGTTWYTLLACGLGLENCFLSVRWAL